MEQRTNLFPLLFPGQGRGVHNSLDICDGAAYIAGSNGVLHDRIRRISGAIVADETIMLGQGFEMVTVVFCNQRIRGAEAILVICAAV